jgi:hypothetical protein
MASPHSAGAVALLWSCNPALVGQVDQTFQLLQNTADPPPGGNCDQPGDGGNYTYGYGYLNVLAAGQAGCVQNGTLVGHVYDSSANPLPGATVTASPGLTSTTTNVDGLYLMPLPAGNYDVTAAMPGYESQTAPVVIVGGLTTGQDFYLSYEGLWTMGPAMCFDLTRMDAEFYPATGLVYVLGGRSGVNTVGNIYAYNPATGACADTGATMPTPISNYTANRVNDGTYDLLCTFGGRKADGTNTLDVQCYNPLTNLATVVAQLPASYTDYIPGAQVVFHNYVYVFGGFRNTATPYDLALTYRYDPVGKAFSLQGSLNLARGYLFGGVIGNEIYAFGGTTYDGASLIPQTRAEVLHTPLTWGWWDDTAVADLPVASAEGRAFSFDEYIYPGYAGKVVLAGGGQWPDQTEEALIYDAATDSYDYGFPDLNVARRDHAGVLIPLCTDDPTDGQPALWVIGGRCVGGSCGVNDNPPYAPAEYLPLSCVQPVPACQPFPQRGAHAVVPAGPTPFGLDPVRAGWGSTDFQALNLAPDTQPFTAYLLDPLGQPRATVSDTLPAGGTGVYTPAPSFPPGFTGTLVLATPGRMAMGVVHLEQPPEAGGNTVFPGVPDETLDHQAYTPVDDCTILHIHNLDLSAIANVTLFLYDLGGMPIGPYLYTIAPQGTLSVDLRTFADLPHGFTGAAVVAADQLIHVTVQSVCQGYSAFVATPYCAYELYAPYVPGYEPGWMTTTITLQNPSGELATAVVSYTGGLTMPVYLPGWGSQVIPSPFGGGSGWAHIRSNLPLVAIVQTASRDPANPGISGYRVQGTPEASRAVALPVLFSGDHGWLTANRIWVMNIGSGPTRVAIRFSNSADDSLAWARQVVQPGEVWQVALPPVPGTRAAAIVLADPPQPIIAVAGAANPNPEYRDSQILYAGTNFPFPYAPVAGADFSALVSVNIVTLDGSVAGGDSPITYAWDLGDGLTTTGQHVVHMYSVAGTYTVTMTATNGIDFFSDTMVKTVTVEQGVAYSVYLPLVGRGFQP